RPHPEEAMALERRIGAHAGRRARLLLRRHAGTAPARIEGEAMVAAHHVAAFDMSHRKRQPAMPARILQHRNFAFGRAPQRDVLVADRARQHTARTDFMAPRCRVPGVEREWMSHLWIF